MLRDDIVEPALGDYLWPTILTTRSYTSSFGISGRYDFRWQGARRKLSVVGGKFKGDSTPYNCSSEPCYAGRRTPCRLGGVIEEAPETPALRSLRRLGCRRLGCRRLGCRRLGCGGTSGRLMFRTDPRPSGTVLIIGTLGGPPLGGVVICCVGRCCSGPVRGI